MIPGQVVVIDGAPWVLARWPQDSMVTGHGGVPIVGAVWTFRPLHTDVLGDLPRYPRRYRTHGGDPARGYAPSDTLPPMVPECRSCHAPLGDRCAHLEDRVAQEVGA